MKVYNKPIAEIVETLGNIEGYCLALSSNDPVLDVPGYIQSAELIDKWGDKE